MLLLTTCIFRVFSKFLYDANRTSLADEFFDDHSSDFFLLGGRGVGCSCKIKTSSAGGPLGLRQTETRGEGV